MIVVSTTPNGIRLTRGADSYTATGPATLASLIVQLTHPATLPVIAPLVSPAPAGGPGAPRPVPALAGRSLGQRLADARAKLVQSGAK